MSRTALAETLPGIDQHQFPAEFEAHEHNRDRAAERAGKLALAEHKAIAEAAPSAETRKSFDVLASVRMFRHDLQFDGYEYTGKIKPETRERVLDEDLTYLVEGVDRAARTSFVLQRGKDGDLTYNKNGDWESYTAMLLRGREVAIAEAKANSDKQFLADEAVRDLAVIYKIRALKPGEQFAYANAYPQDVEDHLTQKYGRAEAQKKLQQWGRFPHRKMGFLYLAQCLDNGNVVLESQTVDRSNDRAFAAALDNPQAAMDQMVDAYDAELYCTSTRTSLTIL